MASITFDMIEKNFGRLKVIENINLSIASGEFIVFVGPSGCGKSTLLRIVAGLEEVSSGKLYIDDEMVNEKTPRERGVAMVFQSYALYPHMTTFENMAFGLEMGRQKKKAIKEKVEETAKLLHILPLLDRLPRQLSGGQRQRVAIGRALVRDPRIFLFDEPLSNLDASLRVQMRLEIARLHQRVRATMIYVTHDQVEAMTLADRIVVLNNGRIEQVGTPLELYSNPANRFVAGFIGSPAMNFLPVSIAEVSGKDIRLDIGTEYTNIRLSASVSAKGLSKGDNVELGIRPEDISISDKAGIPGEILVVEQLGESHLLHVGLNGNHTCIVRGQGTTEQKVGSKIALTFNRTHSHLFRSNGMNCLVST